MASKKGSKIIVGLVCSKCKATNYHTQLNKSIRPKLQIKKYCKMCRERTIHNSREKLK